MRSMSMGKCFLRQPSRYFSGFSRRSLRSIMGGECRGNRSTQRSQRGAEERGGRRSGGTEEHRERPRPCACAPPALRLWVMAAKLFPARGMRSVGTFRTDCRIEHTAERRKGIDVPKLLVDTGSEYTWIPGELLERI